MNGKDIFLGLKYVGDDLVEEAEYGRFSMNIDNHGKTKIRRPFFLAALIALLLLLVGCAIVCATAIFESQTEMISALYGENTGFDSASPTEAYEQRNDYVAEWTVPGYEKLPIEETVAQELENWISPVGQCITADGYKLTVDSYLYDSITQCGLITMLLEHDHPISEEELLVGYNGEISGISGNYLFFNQYGRAYLIPAKTNDTQLAFTYYFRMDRTSGDSLIVSFPNFEEQAKFDELMALREEQIPKIRQRLKEEMTIEEAAQKCQEVLGFSGYTGEYDDYYFLAGYEFDTAHAEDQMSQEQIDRNKIEQELREDLTPEEAVAQLTELWGQELLDEMMSANEQSDLSEIAYSILAQRTYDRTYTENKIIVSFPDSMELPNKTFGDGDVLVNTLCVRVNSSKFTESDRSEDKIVFHMTDGTDFVVTDSLTQNVLFTRSIEHGQTLYMLNSAINIDKIQSVGVSGSLTSTILEADSQ